MNHPEIANCFHEPFGEAFFFGPERVMSYFDELPDERHDSCVDTTYRSVCESISKENDKVCIQHRNM